MKELDLMNDAPKINDLKMFLSAMSNLLKDLKEENPEGLEKTDLIASIIENAQNELLKVNDNKTIDDLPINQQARIFADIYCLQGMLFDGMEEFDEDDEDLEEDEEEEVSHFFVEDEED